MGIRVVGMPEPMQTRAINTTLWPRRSKAECQTSFKQTPPEHASFQVKCQLEPKHGQPRFSSWMSTGVYALKSMTDSWWFHTSFSFVSQPQHSSVLDYG